MTLFQMTAAIAASDAAMVLEGVDAATRKRVVDRLGKSLAQIGLNPPNGRDGLPVLQGTGEREALAMLERTR